MLYSLEIGLIKRLHYFLINKKLIKDPIEITTNIYRVKTNSLFDERLASNT